MNTETANTPDQQNLKDELTRFTLFLIQALLKTGYYASEHPASLQAKTGIYENFIKLLGDKNEITFIKFVQPEKPDVIIEGVIDEQFSLKSAISGGMAELYIPQFVDYFVSRNLTSFSIKRAISKDTFEAFLELMSKPIMEKSEDREAFPDKLRSNGIFNVSVIFDADLPGDIKKLPWRVRLTLARFIRDISLLPVFANSTAEEIKLAKITLLKEIVRPLSEPALLKDVLFNTDLVVKHTPDEADIDLNEVIVSAMPEQLLVKTGELMLAEYNQFVKIRPQKPDQDYIRKEKRYFDGISKIAYRLIKDNSTAGDDLLENIHVRNIVAFEALPERIRKAIRIKKFAKKFINNPKHYLSRIMETEYVEENDTIANMVVLALPELLKTEKAELVSDVISILEKNRKSSQVIQKAVVTLGSDEILNTMEQMLLTANPGTAYIILNVYRIAGKHAVPHLINILLKIENIGIRRRIIDMLVEMATYSEPYLLKELQKSDQPWFMLRNIILILGDIRSMIAAELFSELWTHKHPRVREEILSSTYKVFGKDGEGIFIEALEDKDADVKKKAIYYLGLIKSTDKNVVINLIDIIKKHPAGEREPPDTLQIQTAVSLGLIGNYSKENYDAVQRALIDAVTYKRKGMLGLGKSETQEKSDIVKIAVCNALGMLNSNQALPLLEKFGKSKNNELAKTAEDAISKIKSVNSA